MKFCPECGSPIKDQMRFCTTCGADLSVHREREARRAQAASANQTPPPAPLPSTAPELADFIIPILSESLRAGHGSEETLRLVREAVKEADPDGKLLPDAILISRASYFVPQNDGAGVSFCTWASSELNAIRPDPVSEEPPVLAVEQAPAYDEPAESEPDQPDLPAEPAEEISPDPIPEPAAEPEPKPEADLPAEPEPEPEPEPDVPPEPEAAAEAEPEPAAEPSEPVYIPKYKEAIRRARDHFYYADARFALPAGSFDFRDGLTEESDTLRKIQLEDASLWAKFADLFRHPGVDDADSGWRCEYWGKMMRGACYTYAALPASADEEKNRLYAVLEGTVRDLLTAQDGLGRFSTYSVGAEFAGWDIWGRKYVLLGMIYFLDICRDDRLADEIVEALTRHADYMISKLGRPEEGKRLIAACTSHWDGLNSCSVLEPFMLLYNITHEPRYFDFAEYIISFGGTLHENLFELAYEDKTPISDYSVTKAYEMISCFEGLAEYAKVTGDAKSRETVIRFAERVLREEETVIGTLGCLYESFDLSAVSQFDPQRTGIMQETCVTVTWMKFCWQLWRMTGDNKWIDAIEKSAYNAMSAALRRHIDPAANGGVPLPIHSYNPLRHDVRTEQIGGKKNIDDQSCYGCCVCISSAGFALDTLAAAGCDRKGRIYINLYRNGTITAGDFTLRMETDYPKSGVISFAAGDGFEGCRTVVLRIPGWAERSSLNMGGVSVRQESGCYTLSVTPGARFTLEFDLPVRIVTPAEASHGLGDSGRYLAVRRGPVLFALDETVDEEPILPVDPVRTDAGEAVTLDSAAVPCRQAVRVPLLKNGSATLIDYASAGQEPGHKVCAWIRVK